MKFNIKKKKLEDKKVYVDSLYLYNNMMNTLNEIEGRQDGGVDDDDDDDDDDDEEEAAAPAAAGNRGGEEEEEEGE